MVGVVVVGVVVLGVVEGIDVVAAAVAATDMSERQVGVATAAPRAVADKRTILVPYWSRP